MISITLKTTPETEKLLREYPQIYHQALVEGFKLSVYFAEAQIKKSFGRARGRPKVRKGQLRQSIFSSIKAAERNLIASIGSNKVYAAILEEGGRIRAKGSGYLTFKTADGWHKVKEVTIPPYPYLKPGIEENLEEIEKIITDEIAKRAG